MTATRWPAAGSCDARPAASSSAASRHFSGWLAISVSVTLIFAQYMDKSLTKQQDSCADLRAVAGLPT